MWMLLILLANPAVNHPCPVKSAAVTQARLAAIAGAPAFDVRFTGEGDLAAAGALLGRRIQDVGGRVDAIAVTDGTLQIKGYLPDAEKTLPQLAVPGRLSVHALVPGAAGAAPTLEAAAIQAEDFEVCAAALAETPGLPAAINLTLTAGARDRLAELTKTHLNQPLALVLDGRTVSSPVVKEAITGGRLQISGAQLGDALVLQAVLRSGPLPVLTRVALATVP